MTYSQFIKETSRKLSELYPEREAGAMAARLLQHFCGISSYEHLVEPFGAIAPEVIPNLERAVSELAEARPLQYIIGWQEFCGLQIAVEEGVLIPRPETEQLVMWVAEVVQSHGLLLGAGSESAAVSTAASQTGIKTESEFVRQTEMLQESQTDLQAGSLQDNLQGNSLKILDAASGSGCIACALASKLPQAKLFACDISDKALEITSKNLGSCGSQSAHVFKCDLLQNAAQTVRENIACQTTLDHITLEQSVIDKKNEPQGSLDIIVSNPPYVTELEKLQMKPNVLEYEPHEALFVPDTNPFLFYRALKDLAIELLVPGGALFMEINEQFANETAALFSNEYFSKVEIRNDIFDKPRMIMAVKTS